MSTDFISGRARMLRNISTQFGLIDSIRSRAAQKTLVLFPLLRTKDDLAETKIQDSVIDPCTY